MRLLSKLTKLKLMSKMYEHTFRNAGNKMSEKEMNAFLSLIEKGTYDGIDMTRRILSAYATGAFDLSFLALLVKMKSQKTMR